MYNQGQSLSAIPVLFPDIKNYFLSPRHLKIRVFEAIWNASIDLQVAREPSTRLGQPATLRPDLILRQGALSKAPGTKSPRASACEAKDIIKKRFQHDFNEKLGLR